MGRGGVDRMRRGIRDVRADRDEGWTVDRLSRLGEGRFESLEILSVPDPLDVPTVGPEASQMVLAVKRDRGRAVDRYVVVVVADGQLAETEMARDRSGLLSDPLHQIAVGGDRDRLMIERFRSGTVEPLSQKTLGEREPDRVAESLTQRTGRDLDPRSVGTLGMARRPRAPLPKLLQVIE